MGSFTSLTKTALSAGLAWLGLGLISPAFAQGMVWVVDDTPGPGVDFPTIQKAINAAVDGDTILVKYGVYPAITIANKSLSIINDSPIISGILGGSQITSLAAGKHVLLSGFNFSGTLTHDAADGIALTVQQNAGSVRIQNCNVQGAYNFADPDNCWAINNYAGMEAVVVSNSPDVAFSSCTLFGGNGVAHQESSCSCCTNNTQGGNGANGIVADQSTIAFYDTQAYGGWGGQAGVGASSGGHGYKATGTASFASGSEFIGGDGGYSWDFFGTTGGNAGHGVRLSANSHAAFLGVLSAGGNGGVGAPGGPGLDGQGVAGGIVANLPGTAHLFEIPVPIREQTTVPLKFTGAPFDSALLLFGTGDTFSQESIAKGVLLVSGPQFITFGSLGASGTKTFDVPVGALPAGVLSTSVVLQSLFISQALGFTLGSPRTEVLLSASL